MCFSFSISCFNEYSGLISFRIDWFDLLAVQGTLKSLSIMLAFCLYKNKDLITIIQYYLEEVLYRQLSISYFIVVFLSTREHISEKRGVAWGWGQSVKLKKLQKKKREVQAWEGIEAATGKVQKRRKQKKELDLLLKPEGLWAGLRV